MSARRARVLYLSHAFMVGGAEEMVLNLVRHLPDRFEPCVSCINQAGPIGEEIKKTGVPFRVLGLDPGIRRPWDLIGIQRYLRELQPDIVHTFLLTASLYGRLAAMLARVPIIIGTEVNIYEQKQPHHALAERIAPGVRDRAVRCGAVADHLSRHRQVVRYRAVAPRARRRGVALAKGRGR